MIPPLVGCVLFHSWVNTFTVKSITERSHFQCVRPWATIIRARSDDTVIQWVVQATSYSFAGRTTVSLFTVVVRVELRSCMFGAASIRNRHMHICKRTVTEFTNNLPKFVSKSKLQIATFEGPLLWTVTPCHLATRASCVRRCDSHYANGCSRTCEKCICSMVTLSRIFAP